jgi:hypothetical protein
LCFTGPTDAQIEKGIGILGDLFKAEIRRAKTGRKRSTEGSGVALV